MKVTLLQSRNPDVANIFVLGEEGQPALIFDFGDNANHRIEEYCAKHHSGIAGIFLTHGHYDHIAGLNDLKEGFDAPVVIHVEEVEYLTSPRLNVSEGLFGEPFELTRKLAIYRCEDEDEITCGAHQVTLETGEKATVGGYEVHVIHTPFHTRGSVCYYLPEHHLLFSGDTLFKGGIGREDLPGAMPRLREASLRKLAALPEETIVYPGHGPRTSIANEIRYNPFLKR